MSDGLSSLRTSRINLVDLAGSERQKVACAAGERLKEASNINRSLSQLGNLINILAEVSQSGKQRHIPYRDSRLTFLLQESLGGNAKLAMICAISPYQRCKNETFSTLRFAQRAKAIKNQAVVNETMEDDVNVLREQIRQLKDELLRIKSNDTSTESHSRSSSGWNVQRSLNLLRLSLCRPRTLPVVDEDSDEEMEIVKEGVEVTCVESHTTSDLEKCRANEESNSLKELKELKSDNSDTDPILNDADTMQINVSDFKNDQNTELKHSNVEGYEMGETPAEDCRIKSQEIAEIVVRDDSVIPDVKEDACQDECEPVTILAKRKSLDSSCIKIIEEQSAVIGRDPIAVNVPDKSHSSSTSQSYASPCSIASPMSSNSPRLKNCDRKSLSSPSLISVSQKYISSPVEHDAGIMNVSFADNLKHSNNNVHPTLSNRNSLSKTEHLAASIRHGLQIIEGHQRSSSVRNSSFRFSLKPVDLRLLTSTNKVDIGIQTYPQESNIIEDSSAFICSYCKNNGPPRECENSTEHAGLQIVPVDDCRPPSKSQSVDRCKKLVPKAVEKVLAGAIRREMALEDHCAKQAAEIMHLNRLVQQYKHERECLSIIEQTRQDKICRLEGLMDGVIPTEEFMEEEFLSLRNEHMEQAKHSDRQLIYQCRCSFLEIYNEQITDLLDPTQRNLQIREDIRTGVYVDCLTEVYVCQMKDVIQLLIKGLSNRRIGATSINTESSRSHCVFTCVVKCRSKSMSDGLSSLRTSRINLVDLAGSERKNVTCATGERLKEASNINRSLSQLG